MHHTIHHGRWKEHSIATKLHYVDLFFQEDNILKFLPFRVLSVFIFDGTISLTNAIILILKSAKYAQIVITVTLGKLRLLDYTSRFYYSRNRFSLWVIQEPFFFFSFFSFLSGHFCDQNLTFVRVGNMSVFVMAGT